MHFHGHGAIWLELLDEEDGRPLTLETGARGEVVLTQLRRRAQALVRYQTNDVMEIIDTEPCPCGRSSFRFQLHGRADDMFVVRGINVFPSAIARALTEVSPDLTEFAIVLPPTETFDQIPLLVEARHGSPPETGYWIEESVKHLLGCGSQVTLLEPGALPRTHGKTRRLYRDGEKPPLSTAISN
jgi:phenylacetate-CoA ligase